MDLGPVSLLDCVVFVTFLIPQLLIHAPLINLIVCGLRSIAWIIFRLPRILFTDRFAGDSSQKPPFLRNASFFQLLVLRCVRYAFANMPPSVGRVFFSKHVALPFFTFRLLRHGYWRGSTIHWEEIQKPGLQGLWMIQEPTTSPDIVVLYIHGGGFAMGSSYFYMEFLLTWVKLLAKVGYRNPALFALDYTLVPQASFPAQLHEAHRAYRHVRMQIDDPSRICVSGDSAGGTLVLSLLLLLAQKSMKFHRPPGAAVLISPWPVLLSHSIHDTPIDYLNQQALYQYGGFYAGTHQGEDYLVSPGCCHDAERWEGAAPSKGICVLYGEDEVLAPDIKRLIQTLKTTKTYLHAQAEREWGVHAWPVVKYYLGATTRERDHGISEIVDFIRDRIH